MKKLLVVIFSFFLIACGAKEESDVHKAYLGTYVYSEAYSEKQITLEIRQKGGDYELIEDTTKPDSVVTLSISPKGFKMNGKSLALSEDKSTLFFNNKVAKRRSN